MTKSIIIILVLLLIIIVLIYLGVYHAKKKVREFSRSVLGTDSVQEGFQKIQQEYAETPKSVSAMTSLCLPNIMKDFPDFQYDEMKERAENVLQSYLLSITNKNPSYLKEGNQELKDKLSMYVSALENKGLTEHFDNIKIHRTEIAQYRKADGRCIVTFQSSIQYYHYITDSTGTVQEGNQTIFFQSKYSIDLIYIQDRNIVENELDLALGVNCPNCGAPVSGLGAKFCEYCGTPIIELNIHAWSFSDVNEITT